MIDFKKHFPCIVLALLLMFMNTLRAQTNIINELSTLNGGFFPRAAWSICKLCNTCNGPSVRGRHEIHHAMADGAPNSSGSISILSNIVNDVGVVCEQNQNTYTHSRRACMLMSAGTYGFNRELNAAHALATVAANENIITSVVTDNSQLNNTPLYKNANATVNGSTSGNHSILNIGTDIFAAGKKGSTNTEYWDGNIAEILVFAQAFQAPIQKRMLGNLGHYFRVPTAAPTAPISLSATRNNATVVNLIWLKPASDGGSDITDYTIEYKKHTDSLWMTYNDGISVNTRCAIPNLLPDTVYDFRVSAVNSIGTGEAANTSTISNPLPLKWLGFEGYLEEPNIKLKWTTALEYNCSHFEIERSFADKESFQTISCIRANGSCLSQTYTFTDSNITNGYSTNIFYRIKQVDINADYTYSNIIRLITAATDIEEIQIVPNPTSPQTIYISIPESYGNQHEATLSDEAGKCIDTFHITGNSSFYPLTGLHLKPGVYSLTINSGGTYHHSKLIITE